MTVRNTSMAPRGGILIALTATLVLMLPDLAPAQQSTTVYCDECAKIARDALLACQRSSPMPVCTVVARQVRDNCDLACVSRPAQVACTAANVQHWDKIVFRIPKDRRIERTGNTGGAPNSLAEVIVKSEPNDMLDPFVAVKRVLELRDFCVRELDANQAEVDSHCNNLLGSDIEIVNIAYAIICAEKAPPVQ